jgi:hypothetical protein
MTGSPATATQSGPRSSPGGAATDRRPATRPGKDDDQPTPGTTSGSGNATIRSPREEAAASAARARGPFLDRGVAVATPIGDRDDAVEGVRIEAVAVGHPPAPGGRDRVCRRRAQDVLE